MIEIVEKLYNNVKQKWNGIVLVIGLEDYCYHITQIIGIVPINQDSKGTEYIFENLETPFQNLLQA